MVRKLFCKNCEGSEFTKRYGLTMGPTPDMEGVKITWSLYKCIEWGLLKLVTEEETINQTES